jgi:protein Tex
MRRLSAHHRWRRSLDASGVHPEAYPVVRKIIAATRNDIKALIGNADILCQVKPQSFVDETFGLATVPFLLPYQRSIAE